MIQMAQSGEDMSFEERLISEHLKELLENRLPEIAKKMNCHVERVNEAVTRIGKLDTSPGLAIGRVGADDIGTVRQPPINRNAAKGMSFRT